MVKEQYYTAMEPAPNIRWFLAFLSPKTDLMLAKKTKKQQQLCTGPMNAGFNQRMIKKRGNYYKGNEVVLQEK